MASKTTDKTKTTRRTATFGDETYRSVAEMVRDSGGDPKFADDLERHVNERRLIKRLVALRCARGISQKDIAAKMGCSQGRISKLESAADDDLRLGDIKAYAGALGLCTILGMFDRKSVGLFHRAVVAQDGEDMDAPLAEPDLDDRPGPIAFAVEGRLDQVAGLIVRFAP